MLTQLQNLAVGVLTVQFFNFEFLYQVIYFLFQLYYVLIKLINGLAVICFLPFRYGAACSSHSFKNFTYRNSSGR